MNSEVSVQPQANRAVLKDGMSGINARFCLGSWVDINFLNICSQNALNLIRYV